MYRLKEAIVIFWAVLTHKYYFFASVKRISADTPAFCYLSSQAENTPVFCEAVSEYADKVRKSIQSEDNKTARNPTSTKWHILQARLEAALSILLSEKKARYYLNYETLRKRLITAWKMGYDACAIDNGEELISGCNSPLFDEISPKTAETLCEHFREI